MRVVAVAIAMWLSVFVPEAMASTVYVGVPPLRPIVSEVLGPEYTVEVLLPSGASPETFEPQGRQLAQLSGADALFVVGLPFETLVADRLERGGTAGQVIRLIDARMRATSHPWLDPMSVLSMAERCADWAVGRDSEAATRVQETLVAMRERLELMDDQFRLRLAAATPQAFMTVHPAYDAFASRYGLEEISIEVDGRMPTGRSLVELLERARSAGAELLFTQPQHTSREANAVARELDLRMVEIDPLREDFTVCMRQLVEALAPSDHSR